MKTCLFSTELPISGQFVDHFYEKNWLLVKSEILVKQKTENAQFKLIRMLVHCIRGQEINKEAQLDLGSIVKRSHVTKSAEKVGISSSKVRAPTIKLLPKAKRTPRLASSVLIDN